MHSSSLNSGHYRSVHPGLKIFRDSAEIKCTSPTHENVPSIHRILRIVHNKTPFRRPLFSLFSFFFPPFLFSSHARLRFCLTPFLFFLHCRESSVEFSSCTFVNLTLLNSKKSFQFGFQFWNSIIRNLIYNRDL